MHKLEMKSRFFIICLKKLVIILIYNINNLIEYYLKQKMQAEISMHDIILTHGHHEACHENIIFINFL